MTNNLVARFLDGTLLKGTSLDVDASKTMFHLRTADGKVTVVHMKELKALFFVRSLEGDGKRDDAKSPAADDPRLRGSTPISVKFADNETIVGLTNRYPPTQAFFFILPVDPVSNNIRILVNRSAVEKMESPTG